MDSDVVETDEDILAFEVADDALERAAQQSEFALTGITAAGRYSFRESSVSVVEALIGCEKSLNRIAAGRDVRFWVISGH